MNNEERKNIAITVAKMYYIHGESQEQIAVATGMSRSNISRILRKCIQDGVVEIVVHDTISENAQRRTSSKCFLDSRMSSSFPPPQHPTGRVAWQVNAWRCT